MRVLLNDLIERNSKAFSVGTLIIASAIFLITLSFCVSMFRMPYELRGGMESWGTRLSANDNTILREHKKIIKRMDKIEDDLLYLEVYLFENQINAQIDKDQRNIREKLLKVESDRQDRIKSSQQ